MMCTCSVYLGARFGACVCVCFACDLDVLGTMWISCMMCVYGNLVIMINNFHGRVREIKRDGEGYKKRNGDRDGKGGRVRGREEGRRGRKGERVREIGGGWE